MNNLGELGLSRKERKEAGILTRAESLKGAHKEYKKYRRKKRLGSLLEMNGVINLLSAHPFSGGLMFILGNKMRRKNKEKYGQIA